MKKDKDLNKISIDSFFNAEADHIKIAHSHVKLIHNTGNISASGSHLEVAIRDFFKTKLPNKFYVTDGHIIDFQLKVSPQLDFIIAENSKTPVLYETMNSVEYLAYESIYSYGEIKSSWNKKYINEFVITSERIFKFLKRDNISQNHMDIGGKGIELDISTTKNPIKNPLFKFMFIASSDKFNFEDIKDTYEKTSNKYLPNIICLFDKGVIVNINKNSLNNGEFKINLYPEFNNPNDDNEWVLLNYNKERSSLGTLYYIILEHLNTSVLGYPNMLNYMQQIFDINLENIDFIKEY